MNTELCIFALIAFSLTGFAVAVYQIFCIKLEAAYQIFCIKLEVERIKKVMLCIITKLEELEEKNKNESH